MGRDESGREGQNVIVKTTHFTLQEADVKKAIKEGNIV